MTAADIARALDPKATRSGRNWVLRCPCHDDKNASLSLADGRDGKLLVRCFAGCDPRAILDHLRAKGWLDDARPEHRRHCGPIAATPRRWPAHGAPEDDGEATRLAALALWRETKPAPGTLVDLYLEARGYTHAIPPTIRFHPALRHGPSRSTWPAMVAVIESADGRFLGVHRTWLALDDGLPTPVTKAPVPPAKMTLGPWAGGACRLAPAGRTLIVAEGMESALSAMQLAGGLPGWAALSTSGLKALALPPCVERVVIAADHDANGAGQRAARDAALRWRAEGRRVSVRLAPTTGDDLNDVLRKKAS